MKTFPKSAIGIGLAGALVLVLAACGLWLVMGRASVEATGNAEELGIDAEPTNNTATYVDDVDSCIEVANDATFDIDVYVKGIPGDDGMAGYEYYFEFDDTLLEVTGGSRPYYLPS